MILVERVLVVPERLGEPAAQHRYRRPGRRRHTDDVEFAAAPGGSGIVLDLKGGTHRLQRHDRLQFQRQRGDGEIDVLEFLPRVGPFALTGIGQPLPQLRIVIVADRGTGEIL